MLDSFEREEDLSERKQLHCASCKRMTIHYLEARCRGKWSEDDHNLSGGASYSIFRCGGCDDVCYETASWHSEEYYHDEHGDIEFDETVVQYPAPVSAHFSFNTESVPDKLKQILDEMLYALAGSKMILATIGLRLSLEFIVNDSKCQGRNLKQKIDDLKNRDVIDDDQKALLHRLREKGNAGAHDAAGMRAAELVAGMSIVEGLLEKIYNGPARHEATLSRAKMLLSIPD